MRREKRRGSENQGVDFKKVLYISGSVIAVAIIGFVVTFFVYGNKLGNETNLGKLNTNIVDNYSDTIGKVEQTSSSMGKTVNEVSSQNSKQNTNIVSDSNSDTKNNTNTTKYAVNTSEVEKKKTNTNSNTVSDSTKKTNENTTDKNNTVNNDKKEDKTKTEQKKEEEKAKEPSFKMPVKGEIIKEYAKDKLVYSNTLGEWVTHNGIDIKAEKTTVVKSSEAGTVKSIKNDPRYGLTIVIEHNNGFTTVYSNLLTAEFVVVGEKVEQGQTIGTVGSTATFEISDESHLHFEVLKDGAAVDPELYIKE